MDERDLGGRIARRALRAGVEIDPAMGAGLAAYVTLLWRWNRRVNLTRLAEDDRGLDRLVVEPLMAARHVPPGTGSMVDVGSGGGSPAVPLKLALPAARLLMVESRARKAAFLRDVVRQLGLTGAEVEACRYEVLAGRPDLREAADVVTVRAVRVDEAALEHVQALLRPGGAVLLFRGSAEDRVLADVRAPLHWRATYRLVEELGSELVVLGKSEEKT